LNEAKLFYEKIVSNTRLAEAPRQQGELALPRNIQSINAFTYANENPDPGFAADSDNIVIQDLGPTPSFSGRPRIQRKPLKIKKTREAQAVPDAPPVQEASASAAPARKFDDEDDEPMIGQGLRSHPSYKKINPSDDANPYLRMFAR